MTTDRPPAATARRRLPSLFLGIAATLLVSALLLAAKSQLSAAFGSVRPPERVRGVDTYPWISPSLLTFSVFGIAGVLLLTYAQSRNEARAGNSVRWRSVGAPALCALVWLAAFSWGLPTYYTAVMSTAPVGPSLPAAIGAWVLTAGGAFAMVIAAAAPLWSWREAGYWPAAGVALGVVISTIVASVAVRAGDDSQFIDATTALSAEVPPYPAALGQRRFTLTLPTRLDTRQRYALNIGSAGTGFVVSYGSGVTAYGADGAERWHYRRIGPGKTTLAMRVYDDGATVVVADYGSSERSPFTLVGLDAVTGEQLWTRRDEQSAQAFDADSRHDDPDPFMIYRDEATWTRFDTRTGRPLWSVANPRGECDERQAVDTVTHLAAVLSCERDGTVVIRLLVADPQTGETVWDHTFPEALPRDAEFWTTSFIDAGPTGRQGVILRLPPDNHEYYVNTVSKLVAPLPPRSAAQTAVGHREEFLLERPEGNSKQKVLSVYGPDGRPRCTTTTPLDVAGVSHAGRRHQNVSYLPLQDGFVVYDFSRDLGTTQQGPSYLRMISGADCQELSAIPFDAFLDFIAAPGVIVTARQDFPRDHETVIIDGYS